MPELSTILIVSLAAVALSRSPHGRSSSLEATSNKATFVSPAPPPPPGRLARLADFAFTRRRTVVVAWVVALVAAFGAAGLAGDWSADYSTPGSESRAAAGLLQERFPQSTPDTVDVERLDVSAVRPERAPSAPPRSRLLSWVSDTPIRLVS